MKVGCCSSDRSAHLTHREKGYSLFCHRCGRKEWEPHGERSIAEIMAARKALDELKSDKPYVPRGKPLSEGPPSAHVWVLVAGISPEEATDAYGFKWHPKSNRVLVPVRNKEGSLAGCIARAVHGERPKYLQISGGKDAMHFAKHLRNEPGVIVVVEDVLSAITVCNAGYDAVAILGTSIDSVAASKIGPGSDKVVSWLDDDSAGRMAAKQLNKRMGLYPVSVHDVTTELDPKLLTRTSVRTHIKQALET